MKFSTAADGVPILVTLAGVELDTVLTLFIVIVPAGPCGPCGPDDEVKRVPFKYI